MKSVKNKKRTSNLYYLGLLNIFEIFINMKEKCFFKNELKAFDLVFRYFKFFYLNFARAS